MRHTTTSAVLAILFVGAIAQAAFWKSEMVTCKTSFAGQCPDRGNPATGCASDCFVRWDEAKCAGCVPGTSIQHEDTGYKCGCSWTEYHRSLHSPWKNWDKNAFEYIPVRGCYGNCK
jgi:hypothetical protein